MPPVNPLLIGRSLEEFLLAIAPVQPQLRLTSYENTRPKPSSRTFSTGAFLIAAINPTARAAADENIQPLADGWQIQSSAIAKSAGADISAPNFATTTWHPASVPTTVMAALVQDGTYKDIYFGTNLATIPTAPFTNSWWYRTEFDVSGRHAAENAGLIFEGINYHANIWLNGQRIADADKIFGAYRIFNLDATGHLKSGKNVLAVEIIPPKPGDFTMGFVDWNPKPPDRNMGLFRPVKLHFYQTVSVENIFAASKIDHATWSSGRATDHQRRPGQPFVHECRGDDGTNAVRSATVHSSARNIRCNRAKPAP